MLTWHRSLSFYLTVCHLKQATKENYWQRIQETTEVCLHLRRQILILYHIWCSDLYTYYTQHLMYLTINCITHIIHYYQLLSLFTVFTRSIIVYSNPTINKGTVRFQQVLIVNLICCVESHFSYRIRGQLQREGN